MDAYSHTRIVHFGGKNERPRDIRRCGTQLYLLPSTDDSCLQSHEKMMNLHQLPSWPQSQEPLAIQMAQLVQIANRLGLHDAADAVKQLTPRLGEVKYGCHVDLEYCHGCEPDGCVIDTGDLDDCIYAKPGMRKEQCKYWRIVTGIADEPEP